MRIVLAPDSFKESMTAAQAIAAMTTGVRQVISDAECVGVPMADGGEGTVDAVVDALDGQRVTIEVADALGRPIPATYGYVAERRLAVIEMAAAAGLEQIRPDERDALRASTFGVGQLISDALDRGATEFLVGLGGSATNDGGAGMLTALGVRLTDRSGAPLPPGGAALEQVDEVDRTDLDPRLAAVRIQLACDVTAPLLGSSGASAVFGPQKGASETDVARLDAALARFAEVTGSPHADTPGAGAAGGLGFALLEFLGATSRPGVEVVAETVGLEQALRAAAWVFTGEGSVDAQTMMGKTPFGVAEVAARTGTKVAIFAGRVAPDASVLLAHGVDEIIGITAEGTPLDQALRDGPAALTRATAEFCRRHYGC